MSGKQDFSQLMKQAQQMQEMLKKTQEELKKFEATGQSGGGAVTVVMKGDFRAISTTLSPQLKGEDRDVIEDLITAAYNDVIRKIQKYHEEKMGSMGSSLGLPGDMSDLM